MAGSNGVYVLQLSNAAPIGWLDTVTPDGMAAGWALDPNVFEQSIEIHLFVDGPGVGSAVWGVSARTELLRPDVNKTYGIGGLHGFRVALPAQFRDGKPHTLYVYGIDATPGAVNPLLQGVPRQFTLVLQQPLKGSK